MCRQGQPRKSYQCGRAIRNIWNPAVTSIPAGNNGCDRKRRYGVTGRKTSVSSQKRASALKPGVIKVSVRREASRTNSLGGVLEDGGYNLRVGNGFTRQQSRLLHFRIFSNQSNGVKRHRRHNRAHNRGVTGKNIVEALIRRGAAEVGGFGRVQSKQTSRGSEDGGRSYPVMILRESGWEGPDALLIVENIGKQELPGYRPINHRRRRGGRRGRWGLGRRAGRNAGGWCLIRFGRLSRCPGWNY